MSPPGRRGRLSILIFHRVLAVSDPLIPDLPTSAEFEANMRWVRDWFNVLPLAEAVEQLYAGRIPSRALAITFDDGYADNEQLAAPILKRLGLTATFFVSTGFLDGGCMWNDRVIEAIRGASAPRDRSEPARARQLSARLGRGAPAGDRFGAHRRSSTSNRRSASRAAEAIVARGRWHSRPPALMMQPQQVRSLRALGMDVGAHTVSHPILTRLSADAALRRDAPQQGRARAASSARLFGCSPTRTACPGKTTRASTRRWPANAASTLPCRRPGARRRSARIAFSCRASRPGTAPRLRYGVRMLAQPGVAASAPPAERRRFRACASPARARASSAPRPSCRSRPGARAAACRAVRR